MARARDEFPNLEEAKPKKIPPPAGESRALPKQVLRARGPGGRAADGRLTADGTDDDKIKLEGVAKGQELSI